MLFDLSGRREEEAEWLQAKIVDRLRRDPALSTARVLPVVHVPPSTQATMTIELSGEVPSEDAEDAVLDVVHETARKLRRDVEVDDRLAIGPPAGGRAA